MSPSVLTLTDEFKKHVFEKVELEDQGILTLIDLLPHLLNKDSKTDVKVKFRGFGNKSLFEVKNLREILGGGGAEEI